MAKSIASKQEKMDLDEVIGRNIRTERSERQLTRDELAEMLDLTVSHMGLIERGERGATAVTLAKLSRVLQRPIDTFFASAPLSSLREDRGNAKATLQKKINSLMTNLDEDELAFLVYVVQGLTKLSSSKE